MADTVFRHGNPVMTEYTPAAGALAEGAVVLVGNTAGWTVGIVHRPIANNVLGELATGGGVYDCVNLNNQATGAKVWWNNSAKKVTNESTNMGLFGFIVAAGGGGANTNCRVLHKPYV
jgi:hypothetical protein